MRCWRFVSIEKHREDGIWSHASEPPIFREVLFVLYCLYCIVCIACEAKYELTKRRSEGGISCSEIEVFGQENGSNKGHICHI